MNAQNFDNKPKMLKETKNKIKVDFERTPLKERLKAKFLSLFFLKKVAWFIVRFILLLGIAYIVLFPFFSQISSSLMDSRDFTDPTVNLIPKHFTLKIYKAIWTENNYVKAFSNTLIISVMSAVLQTFVCCFIAYGLAKFKFKGNKFVFMAVILSLVIPHQTLRLSIFQNFRYFDILGIFGFLDGGGLFGTSFLEGVVDIIPEAETGIFSKIEPDGINLLGTYWPMVIISITGLAFKNGLYIFLLRQFFRGVPDELEESAYIDGSGIVHTFFTIILPISVPMMITVFLFSFSWQWTDDFYTNLFFGGITGNTKVFMKDVAKIPSSLTSGGSDEGMYTAAVMNTGGIMIMIPLIVMYVFCQKYLVQGIERSGLTAD